CHAGNYIGLFLPGHHILMENRPLDEGDGLMGNDTGKRSWLPNWTIVSPILNYIRFLKAFRDTVGVFDWHQFRLAPETRLGLVVVTPLVGNIFNNFPRGTIVKLEKTGLK
ncbi:hypothetical protein ACJX0J_025010, partial [Zea mays]